MKEINNKTEEQIPTTFFEEFANVIKGLTTPQEMADYIQEYVIDECGIINLDYQDALNTLRGVKEGDALVVQTDKDKLQATLKACEAKFKAAHPNMTIKNILLQIIAPQESDLMMDDMQIINEFFGSFEDNLNALWGISSRSDASDKYTLFIMMGFND